MSNTGCVGLRTSCSHLICSCQQERCIRPTQGKSVCSFRQSAQEDPSIIEQMRAHNPPTESPDNGDQVPILVYHRVHPDDDAPPIVAGEYCGHVLLSSFVRQMSYLRDHGFSVITHQELYDWLRDEARLPPKPVLIDFDDNRGAVYDYAVPVLAEYGWPATCFVITALADGKLPEMPHDGWYSAMNWQQLERLRDAGWTIGAHTQTHANLCKLDEAGCQERIETELRGCREDIERELGFTPFCFAYPEGQWNEAVEAVVAQLFATARHWYEGYPFHYVTRRSNLLRLPAHNVSERLAFADFVAFVEQTARGDEMSG